MIYCVKNNRDRYARSLSLCLITFASFKSSNVDSFNGYVDQFRYMHVYNNNIWSLISCNTLLSHTKYIDYHLKWVRKSKLNMLKLIFGMENTCKNGWKCIRVNVWNAPKYWWKTPTKALLLANSRLKSRAKLKPTND